MTLQDQGDLGMVSGDFRMVPGNLNFFFFFFLGALRMVLLETTQQRLPRVAGGRCGK